jgi:pyruvate dehydrogenase E1 component
MLILTPSGLALAPEGGAHQSNYTNLITMGQDGLEAFEPAFADEVAVMMAWGFEHMPKTGRGGGLPASGDPAY